MGFFSNLFSKSEAEIRSNEDFWKWFQKHERSFFEVVQRGDNIEKGFFDKVSPKLEKLRTGYYCLTGMSDDQTAELIISAEGMVKNFHFVEELIQAAPNLKNWKFTALKPAVDISKVGVEMQGYRFDTDHLYFYANNLSSYPDEIDIVVVHNDWTEENKSTITNGTYIFLDNYLGELNFATMIDNLTVIGSKEASQELVPIAKLQDFLTWRQSEFVEKYEGKRANIDEDNYALLEAELGNGNVSLAVINTDLLQWDSKASHPWLLTIEIPYDGNNTNGMPDNKTYQLLDEIEDRLVSILKDEDGYLNIGRQTSNNIREIFYACKDFRKPSQVVSEIQKRYTGVIEMNYDIYKDRAISNCLTSTIQQASSVGICVNLCAKNLNIEEHL